MLLLMALHEDVDTQASALQALTLYLQWYVQEIRYSHTRLESICARAALLRLHLYPQHVAVLEPAIQLFNHLNRLTSASLGKRDIDVILSYMQQHQHSVLLVFWACVAFSHTGLVTPDSAEHIIRRGGIDVITQCMQLHIRDKSAAKQA